VHGCAARRGLPGFHPPPVPFLSSFPHTNNSYPAAAYEGPLDMRFLRVGDPLAHSEPAMDALTGGGWTGGLPLSVQAPRHISRGVGMAGPDRVGEAKKRLYSEVVWSYPDGRGDRELALDRESLELAKAAAEEAARKPGPKTGRLEVDWSDKGPPGAGDAYSEVGPTEEGEAAYWL